jgi:hypothetical protein
MNLARVIGMRIDVAVLSRCAAIDNPPEHNFA